MYIYIYIYINVYIYISITYIHIHIAFRERCTWRSAMMRAAMSSGSTSVTSSASRRVPRTTLGVSHSSPCLKKFF